MIEVACRVDILRRLSSGARVEWNDGVWRLVDAADPLGIAVADHDVELLLEDGFAIRSDAGHKLHINHAGLLLLEFLDCTDTAINTAIEAGSLAERQRCAGIVREIKTRAQAEVDRGYSAFVDWVKCANQILWEIEHPDDNLIPGEIAKDFLR